MINNILVGVPTQGVVCSSTCSALLQTGCMPRSIAISSMSLLANNFNSLWALALNVRKEFGYFVMLHHDVAPMGQGWLDTFVDVYDKSGADVLSCVIPIKDGRGLTTTGEADFATGEMFRYTMAEVMAKPETFEASPGKCLFINTGLWICRLDKPWAEKIRFEMIDRIIRNSKDEYQAKSLGEDWVFSSRLHQLGLKVMATRSIPIAHYGQTHWNNNLAWGQWKTDQEAGDSLSDIIDLVKECSKN